MNLTHHATIRMQQRGIQPLILEWLLEYGAEEYDSLGGCRRYFDKKSRKKLAKRFGKSVIDHLGRLMNHYLIEKNNEILTVGHRLKHISHK